MASIVFNVLPRTVICQIKCVIILLSKRFLPKMYLFLPQSPMALTSCNHKSRTEKAKSSKFVMHKKRCIKVS